MRWENESAVCHNSHISLIMWFWKRQVCIFWILGSFDYMLFSPYAWTPAPHSCIKCNLAVTKIVCCNSAPWSSPALCLFLSTGYHSTHLEEEIFSHVCHWAQAGPAAAMMGTNCCSEVMADRGATGGTVPSKEGLCWKMLFLLSLYLSCKFQRHRNPARQRKV